ncbi:MAG: right-handed parallel beta-helix repeat-containing protein [Cyanothece sp. SIO1E1]|nr:right-handed parallel beta-helix repeat-containing protein [Cyanothece sp. SIO1E1]
MGKSENIYAKLQTENLNFGVAVQGDPTFGTNVVFSVGANLPRRRSKRRLEGIDRVIARLGDTVSRTNSITVDFQDDSEIITEASSQPLMNPEEEEDFRFFHVDLTAASGGDGTFESPFNTVEAALNATVMDGNDVVLVNAGITPDANPIPAFTIPERVQVLSTGPTQLLNGIANFPGFEVTDGRSLFSTEVDLPGVIVVALPTTGDGNFPLITGGGPDLVTLSDRNVLSGFRLDGAAGNSIVGRDITDTELRNNVITNSGERGIFLDDVGGSVVLLDNVVTGSVGADDSIDPSGQGIFIRNTTTLNAVDALIAGFQLENNRVGIELAAVGSSIGDDINVPSQIVEIRDSITNTNSEGLSDGVIIDNTISGSLDQGLLIKAEDLGVQEVTFDSGTISNSGAQGVLIEADTTGVQEITISNSQINNNGGAGLEVDAGTLDAFFLGTQEIFVLSNVIEENVGAGIDLEGNGVSPQEFVIDANLIQNNGGAGIVSVANNATLQEFVTDPDSGSMGIANNSILNNGGQGISLTANDVSVVAADIQNNVLLGNVTGGAPDLEVASNVVADDGGACAVLFNNTAAGGIQLTTTSIPGLSLPGLPPIPAVQGLFEFNDLGNSVPVVLFNSFTGASDPGAFTPITDSSCFPLNN